jgi:hypothetical protein
MTLMNSRSLRTRYQPKKASLKGSLPANNHSDDPEDEDEDDEYSEQEAEESEEEEE